MGPGRINVQAGNFKKGLESQYVHGNFYMKNEGSFLREKILPSQIDKLELATEESVISLGGAAGWGIAGSVLLGPAGLLAGLILGGKGREATFICKFKDGRKFLGTASASVFNELQKTVLAASFSPGESVPSYTAKVTKRLSPIHWVGIIFFGTPVFLIFVSILFSDPAKQQDVNQSQVAASELENKVSAPVKDLSHLSKRKLDKLLSKCFLEQTKHGNYTSKDGGTSALSLLGECQDEWRAWHESCIAHGGKDKECMLQIGVLSQAAIKLSGK